MMMTRRGWLDSSLRWELRRLWVVRWDSQLQWPLLGLELRMRMNGLVVCYRRRRVIVETVGDAFISCGISVRRF